MSRHVREADEVEDSHKPIYKPLGLDGLAVKAKPSLCLGLSHVQDLGLAPTTDSQTSKNVIKHFFPAFMWICTVTVIL